MEDRRGGFHAMLILGINAYHGDASACLLRDGVLVAAAEEERFRRIKHWAGFPTEAIRYCLSEAGVGVRGGAPGGPHQDGNGQPLCQGRVLPKRRAPLSL